MLALWFIFLCAKQWPQVCVEAHLVSSVTFLELFPVVREIERWGIYFSNKRVLFQSDITEVVLEVNGLITSSPRVVRFLRS
ncbi:hypothetical protein FKM82_022791 [Ascaphus truei]